MGLRFFKKFSPSTGVVLSNNTKVQFSTLDGVVGYFATDAAYVQDEFARLMSESRYDISEVDAAEFTRDYVEKKKAGQQSRPLWRDELTRGQLMPSASTLKERLDKVASVVAVGKPEVSAPVSITVTEVNKDIVKNLTPIMKTPAAVFKPNVGKRRTSPNQIEQPATT